jgi:pimeloyl-ACP methyl ester carboxylesterase
VTFNYRGSWGSRGRFSFAGNLDDAKAVLAYLRAPANAAKLRADPKRIVIAGHSMGGWVAAMTGEHDPGIAGTILISAANMGRLGETREQSIASMADNMESLAGVTPETMADELIANPGLDWTPGAAGLARAPLLVLTSEDGLGPMADALAGAVQAKAGSQVTRVHVGTDHGWSGARIRLEQEVIKWLGRLEK